MTTLVLSDLHLGRPGGPVSPESLRPLCAGAGRLVLNGDVAEIHHPEHRVRSARLVLRLIEQCDTDGVPLTVLSGNHDPYLSDVRHVTLASERVFVTHGDVLHPAVAPWSRASSRIRAAHDRALAALDADERDGLEARLGASQHACYAEWEEAAREMAGQSSAACLRSLLLRPWAVLAVLGFWRRFPALAAAFLERHAPEARVGLFGHTHRAGVWRVGERTIVNTGGFVFPGRPHAALVTDDDVRVRRLRRDGGVYRLDREVARIALTPAPSRTGDRLPSPAPARPPR